MRRVPLKMLPFDNKNELQLVLDIDAGRRWSRPTRPSATSRPTSPRCPRSPTYTTTSASPRPMDFNGMVRHYYLRQMPHNVAEIRVNLVGKKHRARRATRSRCGCTTARPRSPAAQARLKIVELPPGPPVLPRRRRGLRPAGQPYDDLIAAAEHVATRSAPSRASSTSTTRRGRRASSSSSPDQEKAALNGVSVDEIGRTLADRALGGDGGHGAPGAASGTPCGSSCGCRARPVQPAGPAGRPRQGPHGARVASRARQLGRVAGTRRSTTRTCERWSTSSPRRGRTPGRVRRST